MKVTEELLNKMKQDSNFSDGIIMPDGDYRLIQDGGHMEALMGLLPYTRMRYSKWCHRMIHHCFG